MAVVATDDFAGFSTPKSGFDHAALITPSDTDDVAHVARGILISVDGALKIDTVGGDTIVFPAGTFLVKTIYPIRAKRVYTTGTTATGIITFW